MAENTKPVVPREDPVVRLERQLAEAKAKREQAAKAGIASAEAALERANNQVTRWTRIQTEAKAKVEKLRADAGEQSPAEADAELDIEGPGE